METKINCGRVALVSARAFLVAALAIPVVAQVTSRVSVSSDEAQGNSVSVEFSISADGRYVAFWSEARNLVIGDTNGVLDVFVRDRQSGATERVSVDSGGAQANNHSVRPSISADGRYVAFQSSANNLVNGDTNGVEDVFVRDRQSGATERVSVDSGGVQGNFSSTTPSLSADGRYVTFASDASNLVSGDTNFAYDIFVRDRQSGTTERVSIDSFEFQGNSFSYRSLISADGRYVAFASDASNLVGLDTNATRDVFVRDRQSGTTARVSVDSGGAQGNGFSFVGSISADGRYVAFESDASNLVAGDTNATSDAFIRDRQSGTTERVSVDSLGAQGNLGSFGPSVSSEGRFVAFRSEASNLVSGDTNGVTDAFVRDRQSGTTERVSVDSGGAQGNLGSYGPSVSSDGRFAAFGSEASNLVSGDTNGFPDVFVHDRDYSPFTSSCNPGTGGVIVCPCANPPSGPGRGCDNSSGTGGAILSASGVAYLSADTLVFATSGEKPTATSIVLQGAGVAPSGVVFGQGVRCLRGALKRLYTKIAVGGSLTAPDFGAGDPSVSARSAALGNVIQPGRSRSYLVYYRDPIVLGGCPASSTFNATQTGEVTWLP